MKWLLNSPVSPPLKPHTSDCSGLHGLTHTWMHYESIEGTGTKTNMLTWDRGTGVRVTCRPARSSILSFSASAHEFCLSWNSIPWQKNLEGFSSLAHFLVRLKLCIYGEVSPFVISLLSFSGLILNPTWAFVSMAAYIGLWVDLWTDHGASCGWWCFMWVMVYKCLPARPLQATAFGHLWLQWGPLSVESF